jgi:hypothetical protein
MAWNTGIIRHRVIGNGEDLWTDGFTNAASNATWNDTDVHKLGKNLLGFAFQRNCILILAEGFVKVNPLA